MLGAIPGKPALGRGPAVDGDYSRHPYHHPAAGWGAAESVAGVLARAGDPDNEIAMGVDFDSAAQARVNETNEAHLFPLPIERGRRER